MSLPLLNLSRSESVPARLPMRHARRLTVAPHVLAACALDGPNPRRRPRIRMLRVLGLGAVVAFCAAFWITLARFLLQLAG